MDVGRANTVYEMLRRANYTKNQAKILALLEQVNSASMAEIVGLLGITQSRATSAVHGLMRLAVVQRMAVKARPGRGRTTFVYRLTATIDDLLSRKPVTLEVKYDPDGQDQ
ncbi:hypothetical protein GCM10007108_01570 [Thermogymnomonas acidicola]|uniref:Uncharacterized protein n=1 Tax=Thermogymnomonas acidicola TaxID=399579 RepID=A0AA37BQC2_9ARCH|nr:hypothetical protein [Thermogymnomonas acidicola]GGM67189.1 hypothetical protein GCM10007108_01570 [Thermogymnomonas acidicola]